MDNKTNEQYLKENGLPRRLVFQDGCIGEWIGKGCFRNLLAISNCYGIYAEAVAEELIKRYNPKSLLQLHWQFKDGHTEMKSQTDADIQKEIKKWVLETKLEYPLPEDAKWLMCNEESEHFLWAVVGKEVVE